MAKSVATKSLPQSLHEVMNALVRDAPALLPARPVSLQALEEALVMLDPLLAALQKQMLDAASDRRRVHTHHDAADLLSVMAADRADSAACAFQTRLLELKRQRHVMMEARALMREVREAAAQARRDQMIACVQRLKLALDEQCARIRDKKKRAAREEEDFFLYTLIWTLLILPMQNNVVTLRHNFSNVSMWREAA